MKKTLVMALALVAIVLGMNSCKPELHIDVTTFVSSGKMVGEEALSVFSAVKKVYEDEICKAQNGEKLSDDIVLRDQSDNKKATEGAIAGAEAAQKLVLAKKTFEVTPLVAIKPEPYNVTVEEGTKEDYKFSVIVLVDFNGQKKEVAEHYYKIISE